MRNFLAVILFMRVALRKAFSKTCRAEILQAMRKVNPKAVWVLQGWQHNR